MGNYLFKQNKIESESECFICWNKIVNNKIVKCVYCGIMIHNDCEQQYKKNNNFSRCPHCQRIGTLCALT